MLSILIPTYNHDCTDLVHDLKTQAEATGIDYEIIVADDASTMPDTKAGNKKIDTLPHCRLIELSENIGRARIRNHLAKEAQYEWILFMDADAKVTSKNFITDYMAHTDADVICGGLRHATKLPSPEVSLRYAYEHHADRRRAAKYRQNEPYERFTPFNFMIRRALFLSIQFDESITEYGHEDTLFGIELAQRKANIRHIDNPLEHTGIENNTIFLEKTRAAIRNLATLEDSLQGHSSLISTYRLLQKMGISKYMSHWYAKHEAKLTEQLTSAKPRLYLFSIFKLGYYCYIKNHLEHIRTNC